MKYRTDLAIERHEISEEEARSGGIADGVPGISLETKDYGEDVKVTGIEITSPEGEKRLEKPMGNYITIEAAGIPEEKEGVKDRAVEAVSAELGRMISFHYHLNVLVVGLGNEMTTPDALGPRTASKIKVTNHLFEMFDADGDNDMARVSCIAPGVTAATGLETADIIKKTAEIVNPEAIIVIDSLAARDIERVSTTIQITDTGIAPGAGMGGRHISVNSETMGAKVIAIGVPTVIDVTTIIRDALVDNDEDAEKIERYVDEYDTRMVVTSTDIDMLIKDFSDIIANGINKTLHPGIYS